jgi:hypothetical protein
VVELTKQTIAPTTLDTADEPERVAVIICPEVKAELVKAQSVAVVTEPAKVTVFALLTHEIAAELLMFPDVMMIALFVVPPLAASVKAVFAVEPPVAVILAPWLVFVVPELITEITNPCIVTEAVTLAPELEILTRL